MASPIFCPLSPALTVTRVGAASDETGLVPGTIEASDSNEGALLLRASGTPTGSTAVDLALVTGGTATGPATQTVGLRGASTRWKLSTAANDEWTGYTWPGFLRDVRVSVKASVTASFPHVSGVRRIASGAMAYVRVRNAVGAQTIQFVSRSSRRASDTTVTVATGVSVDHRPAFVVLPTGRILVAGVISGAANVRIWKSDDNGATWTTWAARTGVGVNASGGGLSMDAVNDAIVLVSGASELYVPTSTSVYWSADGGQNFALGGSQGSGTFLNGALVVPPSMIPVYVTAVSVGVGNADVRAYPVAFGGGFGAFSYVYTVAVNDPNSILGACTMDDGSLWVLTGNVNYPARQFDATVSLDGGLTWSAAGGGTSNAKNVFDTTYASGGYRGIALGCFEGSLVVIARTDTGVANEDNSIHEWWLGGYDQLTETDTGGSSNGSRGQVGYYGEAGGVFAPTDLPQSLGWTKTDVAAGATVTTATTGISIVGTTSNNSVFTAPASFWSPDSGDSVRMRWRTVVTAGSISFDVSYVMISISDGANRQWVKIRHDSNQVRVLDSTGTLWTSSASASFGAETEWMLCFAHDYPSAGGGQASLRYRHASSDAWETAFEAQAIGEEAGVATEVIQFGGTSVVSAADWAISGPWYAYGTDEMDGAWVNPTDLDGRPVSPFVDVQLVNGMSLGGSGDAGVRGDTYTLTPAYSRGAANLLRSLRPSCYAETSQDNAIVTYVLGDGTMPIVCDIVALFGTNYRLATIEFSATDSWASPAFSVSLDAALYASTVSTSVGGLVTLTGAAMIPHAYRSTPNRKFYLALKATNTEVYEILDNDDRGIYVSGLGTGYGGESAVVYGDRMMALIPSQSRMYARLNIPAQQTASDTYVTGTPWFGLRHPISILYDNGFVDSWEPNATEWSTDAGLRQAARRGGETHKRRIAWSTIDRLTTDYVVRLMAMLRRFDGPVQPVLYCMDPDDIRTLGLYTVEGPPTTENSYGEHRTAFERVSQLILTEYR